MPEATQNETAPNKESTTRIVVRWVLGFVLVGVPLLLLGLMWLNVHYMRPWLSIMAPVLAAVLVAHWYLLVGKAPWMTRVKRFAIFAFSMVVLIVVAKATLRYEGSTGGDSAPRFVWKWSPETRSSAAVDELATGSENSAGQVPEGAADSAQFYGPNRNGEVTTTGSLDWATHPPEELWRRPVGLGWSGFAVVGGRAVTQEQRGEEEWVTCYDLNNGELLWKHLDSARFDEKMSGIGPRSTPTIAGGKVWTLGATGILNCIDLVSGEPLWTHDTLKENGAENVEWGKSASPLLIDGQVVVTGGDDRAMLLAYEADSGELKWKSEPDGASYSSPVVATVDGVRQILSVNKKSVTAHEVESGQMLWKWNWDDGKFPKVGQPVPAGEDRVLVSASYGAGSYLLEVKMTGPGGKAAVTPLWKTTRLKTKFSSASVKDGYAYGLDESIFACIDLSDGSKVWKGRRYGFGQQLLVNGDTFLVQTERGKVVLVAATPEAHRELGELDGLAESGGTCWNPPTLAGQYLLLRNEREAVCYRLQMDGEQGP
jgi:outer membrane protein assembly factor BamB